MILRCLITGHWYEFFIKHDYNVVAVCKRCLRVIDIEKKVSEKE